MQDESQFTVHIFHCKLKMALLSLCSGKWTRLTKNAHFIYVNDKHSSLCKLSRILKKEFRRKKSEVIQCKDWTKIRWRIISVTSGVILADDADNQ